MNVSELAACQHGLVTVAQLSDRGVARVELRRRLRRCEWRRVRPHVIALVPSPSTPRAVLREQCLAALLLLPSRAVMCGPTAARLHQVDTLRLDRWLHVLLPPGVRANAPSGVRLHAGPPATVDVIDDVATTDLVRTVADLAATGTLADAVVAADSAARQDPGIIAAARAYAADRRPRGCRRIRTALDIATGRAESALESLAWLLWHTGALPLPMQQAVVRRGGRFLARVDFLWPEALLIVEVDGMRKYHEPFALQREKDRQNALVAEGFTVLRFTWADVTGRPERVVAQVSRALHFDFSMDMATSRGAGAVISMEKRGRGAQWAGVSR